MPKITQHGGPSVAGEPVEPHEFPLGPATEVELGAQQADDYDQLTVERLRAELGHRELPVSGTKPELIARLRADDAADAALEPTDDDQD